MKFEEFFDEAQVVIPFDSLREALIPVILIINGLLDHYSEDNPPKTKLEMVDTLYAKSHMSSYHSLLDKMMSYYDKCHDYRRDCWTHDRCLIKENINFRIYRDIQGGVFFASRA